jgi:phage tail sheath protein FI
MGHDKFTTVLYGGFDGFDIKEKEPLNSARSLKTTATEKNSYGFFSVTKAIEIVKDPERVECNLMAIPGIVNNDLTTRLVRVAEERADTLAVIDIQKDFTPTGENTSTDMVNQGNVDEAVRDMKDRSVDSSYGAAYYPWVQIRDTRNNKILWAPPSVVALGAMAYSDAARDVWFAPAGFNRGGLTAAGAGGVPVVGINQQLTSKQRDKLYEVNVNPIASFPAEGIVIFGQKTLQLTPSALDRINVRRLLIFLKKEISRIASTTLFEPNLEVTWAAFRANADALLSSVKSRLGLADYKLVLDESTTTPELVDRNIMYAKVFLKPARAIEFIALDFIITRSGASFED